MLLKTVAPHAACAVHTIGTIGVNLVRMFQPDTSFSQALIILEQLQRYTYRAQVNDSVKCGRVYKHIVRRRLIASICLGSN